MCVLCVCRAQRALVSAFCFDSYHTAEQTGKACGAMKNKRKTKQKKLRESERERERARKQSAPVYAAAVAVAVGAFGSWSQRSSQAAQRSNDDDDVSDSVVSKTLHCSDVARPRYATPTPTTLTTFSPTLSQQHATTTTTRKNNKSNNNNSEQQLQLLSKLIGLKLNKYKHKYRSLRFG